MPTRVDGFAWRFLKTKYCISEYGILTIKTNKMSNFKKAQQEIKELLQTGFEVDLAYHEGGYTRYEGENFEIVCYIKDYYIKIEDVEYKEDYPNAEPITDNQLCKLEELVNEINTIDLNEESLEDYQNRIFYN